MMKTMMKGVFGKVVWVGRATVFMVGLAVILAVVLGVATMAVAHTGVDTKLFHLGHSNTSNAITKLVGSVAGPMLRLDNNSTGTAATALDLRVESGKAPLTVNSSTKVANLNADQLDDREASSFADGVGGKATNAELLDGQDSSAFLGTNAKAADADKLDGRDSFDFVGRFGTASNSDRLDNIDSTGFVQGNNGRARARTVDIAPGTEQQVLRHESFGTRPDIEVLYNCPNTLSDNGTLTIVNRSISVQTMNVFSDHGAANPNAYELLNASQEFEQEAAATGEHITLQVQMGPGMGTIEVFSVHRPSRYPSSDCHVQAQGLFHELE